MHCRIWCSALVVMAVAVWSWDARCMHCEGYCSTSNLNSAYILHPSSTQPKPSLPVQNTICGSAHYCSPDDGHNKHQISCILLVSISSPYVHDARSQEPKKKSGTVQYMNRNMVARSYNRCCSGSAVSVTYSESELIALDIQYTLSMRHIVT